MPISSLPPRRKTMTVRLDPIIHAQLLNIGQRIGQKPAVLASIAIGDYVTKAASAYGDALPPVPVSDDE